MPTAVALAAADLMTLRGVVRVLAVPASGMAEPPGGVRDSGSAWAGSNRRVGPPLWFTARHARGPGVASGASTGVIVARCQPKAVF